MADNVAVTAGAGTTIAADEVTINATSVKVQRVKLGFGADGSYTGDASAALPLPTTAYPYIVAGGTLTRPNDTTAYAQGDLVSNSTTAASCVAPTVSIARANDLAGIILWSKLTKSGTTTVGAVFRVWLFNVNPFASAPTNGDNGAFALASIAGCVGRISFTFGTPTFTDGCVAFGIPEETQPVFTPVSGAQTLYYVIEARGSSYTPAAQEVFALTLGAQ